MKRQNPEEKTPKKRDYEDLAEGGRAYQDKILIIASLLFILFLAGTYLYLTDLESKIVQKMEGEDIHIFYNSSSRNLTIEYEQYCNDSDGMDYYIKGYVLASGKDYPDICSADYPDVLKEGYCSGNEYKFLWYNCSEGCREGVCIVSAEEESNNTHEKVNLMTGACNASIMRWESGREEPYSIFDDSCQGYRCFDDNDKVSPACYSLSEALDNCEGSFYNIPAKKDECYLYI